MDWVSDMEKKELEQHINSVISLVQNMQKRDEEKSRKIQGLKEELEQNKTAREIQLEAEIQALKSELAEWKRGEFLYGFDPEERKIVDKWFQKHYEENQINDLRKDNFNLKYQLQNLKDFFDKLIKLFKRMIKRDDKEESYLEVLEDMHDNRIINENTFDDILGYNDYVKENNSKEKDDYEL